MRILVAGAASWDVVVHLDRLPEPRSQAVFARWTAETVGSTGAGKALTLARLGHEVHLHTLLGDDEPGHRVASELAAAGVHLHVDRDAVGTEQHVNLMADDGSRLSVYRSVATARPDLDLEPVEALAAECDAVVLNITDYVRRMIPGLVARGVPFWTDLHDWDGRNPYHRDFAEAATWVLLSADALPEPARARSLLPGKELVVCTDGARGAVAWDADGGRHEVPAERVDEVVDTNGAGDAFMAGVLHGLGAGWSLQRALRAGSVAAAAAVRSASLASDVLTAHLLAGATADEG